MSSTDALQERARAAYERGRLLAAGRAALWLAPVVALAVSTCTHPALTCAAGLSLFAILVGLRWRGGIWGRTATVGSLIGLPGLAGPWLFGVCGCCAPGQMLTMCAVVCPTLGLLVGTTLGIWAARQGDDRGRALVGAGLVVAACGALGCGVLGLAALAGLWIGATVAALAAVQLARA